MDTPQTISRCPFVERLQDKLVSGVSFTSFDNIKHPNLFEVVEQ